MKLKRGNEMEMIIFVFVACIMTMFAAIWVYNKKDDSAYALVNRELQVVKHQLKEISFEISQNLKQKETITCFAEKLDKLGEDVDNVQEHCAKLRESQMLLREQLSNKRPLTRFQGPIQVEFIQSAKSNAKKIKELGL